MNPLQMVHDALLELVVSSELLASLVVAGNRVSYTGTNRAQEKDVLSSADYPELRLVPAGGALRVKRTTSSTSCTYRWQILLNTGSQLVDSVLFQVQWELMKVLVRWPSTIGRLVWEGKPFVVRMSEITMATDMYRPVVELGETGLKGWVSVWGCELELFFDTGAMQPNEGD